jgi:hypothetical protein
LLRQVEIHFDFLAGRRGSVSTLDEMNAQYRKAVPC